MLCKMGLALFLLFVLSITPIANATEAHEQTLFVTPDMWFSKMKMAK
jgi:hypothetical protein